jgi:fatty-acyl-CoA synthase
MVAAHPGDAPAIIDRGATVTYGDLIEASRRAARGLADLGVGAGDRVALWLPNVPAWLVLCLACARLGAIVVCVNTRFRSVEVADLVARSGARVLALWPGFKDIDFSAILEEIEPRALASLEAMIVYDEEGGGAASRLEGRFGNRRLVAYGDLEAGPAGFEGDAEPSAACAIFTTSGTTKAPKLVVHTQRSVVDQARIVAASCGFTAADCVSLMALPFCGVFGHSLAMATLAAGRPMVSMAAFEPGEAGRLVRAHQVTHMYGSDDLFHRMLESAGEARPFPSLRLCGYAAFNAALDTIVAEGDQRGVTFVGVYGSSELQALITCQRSDAPAEERSQGGGYPTAPEIRFRARDPDSGELLASGKPGELEALSPGLFHGYLGDEAATAEAIGEDGFFKTGDLGYVEADGRVVFLSRIGDVLRLGGYLTNPAEIEGHIEAHPSVRECKVVAVPTPGGNRAVAFVIAEGGAAPDEEALSRHCAAAIAKYKVPVRYFAIDAFPVSVGPNGVKVRRGDLRQMAEARMAAG